MSFNDYPLGEPQNEPVSSDPGGTGGSVSALPSAASDAGGSASAGGTGAAGGTDTAAGAAAAMVVSDLVVDDFEDGNAAILEQEGRSGSWYVANDGRAMQTPREGMLLLPSPLNPPRGSSTHGAHTFGGPFPLWGALIGTTLATSDGNGAAYDLSDFHGLRFWVRSGTMGPGTAKKVRLNVLTPATIMGGDCTVCSDHFGADVPLTAQWVQVDLPLSSLKQTGYGRPILTTPDLAHAMGIELLFAVNVSFDLWIDDVELY